MRRIYWLAPVIIAAVAGVSSGCGGSSGTAASRYPISAAACKTSWDCLSANAKTVGHPILGPAADSGARLLAAATDAYELTPGAIQVDYTYFATPHSHSSTVREVRGGPKPMCRTLDGATTVTVRGTTGYWETDGGSSRLCWTDQTWSLGVGFPAGTTMQQAVKAANAFVTYQPA